MVNVGAGDGYWVESVSATERGFMPVTGQRHVCICMSVPLFASRLSGVCEVIKSQIE